MKTAVCISGQARAIVKCLPSLLVNVIRPLQADVFFHFWNQSEVNPELYKAKYGLDKDPKWPDFEGDLACNVINVLRPRKFIVQPQMKFNSDKIREACTPENNRMQAVSFQHVFSMFCSIYLANACKSQWELKHGFKYDRVIRTRPDLAFTTPLDPSILADLSKVYIPNKESYGGYNDWLAIGNSLDMDKYSSCMLNINHLFDNGSIFHPESLLRDHLKSLSVPVCETSINCELVR